MPAIQPNLLLLDADQAARERTSSMTEHFPSQLLTAGTWEDAVDSLSRNLIDLIICDPCFAGRGQSMDELIADFHQLPNRHDVPVLFICGLQRSGVSLKTHPWGVAYHVHKSVESQVLIGLIQASLLLRVVSVQPKRRGQRLDLSPQPARQPVPKPRGLTLPEVIMPPHEPNVSTRR